MHILYVIAVVLVVFWILGVLTSTFGSLIHILLAIAIIVVLVRVIQGRKILGTRS